jgi:hypothetical protein
MSKLLNSGDVNYSSAMSNIIQPSWTAAVVAGGILNQGWEACVYPAFDALIVNVLATNSIGLNQQYVMNTVTSTWCSFSGWSPLCFVVFNGQLYFGTAGGIVYKAWDGSTFSDSIAGVTTDITATAHTAYNYFRTPENMKKVELFRALISFDGTIDTRWGVSADFGPQGSFNFVSRAGSTVGSPWDTSPWDTSFWSPQGSQYRTWRQASHNPGYCLSLFLQTVGNSGNVAWAGTDWILNAGGML